MNKKAFTLIELLGVITVLGLIMIIVVPKIKDLYNDYKEKIYYESTDRLVKSFEEYYERMIINNSVSDCTYDFYDNSSDCINFSFDGMKPIGGEIELSSLGEINGCVYFDKFLYSVENSIVSITDNCSIILLEYVFNYTGNEQNFTVPKTGYYKLEVWGAQGGSNKGGFGGYSTGIVYFEKNQLVYVYIGGSGYDSGKPDAGAGGYNGGGNGGSGKNYFGGSGGGGATHIATKSGLLSTLSDDRNSVLIVAGGGGGVVGGSGWSGPRGGSGGGINGVSLSGVNNAIGGTQSSGYLFGQGGPGRNGSSSAGAGEGNGGSGGGWFGGYTTQSTSKSSNQSGAGGSGYIGSSSLMNKSMYCYNCDESNDESTKTISTTNVSSNAVSGYAKEENGYAKITYLGKHL